MQFVRPYLGRTLFGLFCFVAIHSAHYAQGADPFTQSGTLVIIGGGLRFDNEAVWSRIVTAAGGQGAGIAVLPFASGNPERSGKLHAEVLKKYGADAFVVAGHDEELISKVSKAGGVFFTGGDQARIVSALTTAERERTPLLDAIWNVYQKGGVIAGTSAGAAVTSRIMYRRADSVLRTLTNGVRMGHEVDHGLGFMHPEWFVDQHAIVRGRFGRDLVAMLEHNIPYGLAVDEDTAIVVPPASDDGDHVAQVIGYRGVLLLDMSKATRDTTYSAFNVKHVKLSYLDQGDRVNLRTQQVTPSPAKLADDCIDPWSASFEPEEYEQPLFSNDILGNSALVDMMCKLIQGKDKEAIGMAYDGGTAKSKNVSGFEFRLYREPGSVAYSTGAFGGESLTVLNIHLDVRPVTVAGPLYR